MRSLGRAVFIFFALLLYSLEMSDFVYANPSDVPVPRSLESFVRPEAPTIHPRGELPLSVRSGRLDRRVFPVNQCDGELDCAGVCNGKAIIGCDGVCTQLHPPRLDINRDGYVTASDFRLIYLAVFYGREVDDLP